MSTHSAIVPPDHSTALPHNAIALPRNLIVPPDNAIVLTDIAIALPHNSIVLPDYLDRTTRIAKGLDQILAAGESLKGDRDRIRYGISLPFI